MNFILEFDDSVRRKICRSCGEAGDPVPVRSSSAHVEALQQAELEQYERNHICAIRRAA
ncbi:MAG: hypothetical protein WBV94_13870 [Blastocatellia bacterium]